jgi:hypothetical protein
MLKRAGPGDCPELHRRRIKLELLLLGRSVDFERCVKICRSVIG